MSTTRATVSQWKRSRFWAVHAGLELIAVCVYRKGAERVAELVNAEADLLARIESAGPVSFECRNGFADLDTLEDGSHCPACGSPRPDPDEDFCESCALIDETDRRALIEEQVRDAERRAWDEHERAEEIRTHR